MNGICEFLKYTLVEDPEILSFLELENGQIAIKNDYTCSNKKKKGKICPQVTMNVEKIGVSIANPSEMEQCPYHSNHSLLSK
jgi:hypothetical protein